MFTSFFQIYASVMSANFIFVFNFANTTAPGLRILVNDHMLSPKGKMNIIKGQHFFGGIIMPLLKQHFNYFQVMKHALTVSKFWTCASERLTAAHKFWILQFHNKFWTIQQILNSNFVTFPFRSLPFRSNMSRKQTGGDEEREIKV